MELPTVVQQLRAASTAKAQHQAVDASIELLVSTPSLASTQQIVIELNRLANKPGSDGAGFSQTDLLLRLKQVAAVCSSPVNKAEYLGFALLDQIFQSLRQREHNVPNECQDVLLDVYNGNPHVLRGVFAAVENKNSPFFSPSFSPLSAQLSFETIAPLLVRILISAEETCQTKLSLLHTLQRIAWQNGQGPVTKAVTRLLVTALGLTPRSADAVQSFTVLVSVLVDLFVSTDETIESTQMIATTCDLVIARVRFYVKNQIGVLQLLQSLEMLASFAPDALWSSQFLFSCGHALVASCDSHLEKQMVLNIVGPVVEFGSLYDKNPDRSVYVECLALPLISVLSTHPDEAPPLLQLVMDLRARRNYVPSREAIPSAFQDPADEESYHLTSFLRLVDQKKLCVDWLTSLFVDLEEKSSVEKRKSENQIWLSLFLGTLLFDGRRALRDHASMALERQGQRDSKHWSTAATKLLVSSLVFLVSHRPKESSSPVPLHYAEFLSKCFYLLGSLAATTTETMKIVLRLIKWMHSVVQMQPMALKLLYAVWEKESRVYPRLEALLHQEEGSTEHCIVKMATIEALCGKDPELGVEYIGQIQAFLETEHLSVVAMALNAIESLCKADCLDFYAAFKIISLKMRKKKIQCVDEDLFRERLCIFYALGAVEMDANRKHATKLLDQLWELTEDECASVRKLAFESLNAYPLVSLGLCVQDRRGAGADDREDEQDDEITEDDVGEKFDELLELLKSEGAEGVRSQIEKLLTRVLEHESVKLNSGNGRGQSVISSTTSEQRHQKRVSAAATKELKKHFPSLREVAELYANRDKVEDWDGFLLAYEMKEKIEYSSVKRKDKLVKLATQNVQDMEGNLTRVLLQQVAPWDSNGNDRTVFLRILSFMEGWRAFMAKYVDAVEDLSTLKLTSGAEPEAGDQFFAEHVTSQLAVLQDHDVESTNELLRMVAVGALTGQLRDCTRWASSFVQQAIYQAIEKLSQRLARAIEANKVFPNKGHHLAAISAVVGLHLAFGHRPVDSEKEKTTESSLKRIESVLQSLTQDTNHSLLRGVSLGAISHIGCLYSLANASLNQREECVKSIADSVLGVFLRLRGERQHDHKIVERFFPTTQEAGSSIGSLSVQALLPVLVVKSSDVVVTWASLMALVRMSSGFAYLRRLRWLWNLKLLLNHLWDAESDTGSALFGVALGPILLECVKYNLVSAVEVERFVDSSFTRLKTNGKRDDQGFLLIVLHYMLSRMPAHGCWVNQEQSKSLVEKTQQVILSEENSDFQCQLAVAGIANYFHHSLGVGAPGVGLIRSVESGTVEINADPSDIESLVGVARSFVATSGNEIGRFVMGAIAMSSDLFYVPQKKKTFNADIYTLPSKGLLFKVMDILRQEQTSGAVFSTQNENAEHVPVFTSVPLVKSLLSCLTAATAWLPSLDFESPVHRLIKRFCDIDVTVACIRFAMTQGVCDVYTIQHFYSREVAFNLDQAVQCELVSGLALLGERVSPGNLERLLSIATDIVASVWKGGARSVQSVAVAEKWIDTLGKLLASGTNLRVSSESREMAKTMVIHQILPQLPFTQKDGLAVSNLVRSFAQQVLVKIPRQEGLEDYLLGVSSGSEHQWWQNATVFVELLRSGVVFTAEKQASLIFQWILRQDFSRWQDSRPEIRVQRLHELSSFVSVAGSGAKQSQDTVSWLLEVIDAFSRSVLSSASDESATRHALFAFLTGVCGWKVSLSHEQHIALSTSSDAAAVSPFATAFSIGLLRELGTDSNFHTVLGRLWSLLGLVHQSSSLNASSDFEKALRAVGRQAHIETSVRVSQQQKQSILHFWSLDGFK